MAEPSIFNADPAPQDAPQNPATPAAPTISPEVAELVGEGKKYASVDELAKAYKNADNFIATLKDENLTLREAQKQAKAVEELLQEIRNTRQEPPVVPPKVDTPQAVPTAPVDITKTVKEILAAEEAQRAMLHNQDTVAQNFVNQFGDKAEAEYNRIAAEAGLTVNELNRLAGRSPAAVLKLAGLAGKKFQTVPKTNSSVNTQAVLENQPSEVPSAKVTGNTTKDLTAAWLRAGVQE